jgi:hypothetical protein
MREEIVLQGRVGPVRRPGYGLSTEWDRVTVMPDTDLLLLPGAVVHELVMHEGGRVRRCPEAVVHRTFIVPADR